ncbi:MAG: filamentous haemagglutinin family outer membrane protein [uncultured Chloroflexia bacterium]|uniref:Filamentous haemagglutinin family outer membrane protein n=1 Tax=uncultured Chloroflexia bacterium TaxID=1672391 RepID=A0A6J4MHA3_9CHLR|nr:MAG: filamentous haemagglutinin family outer membrane protein [uncultured Chloroflexia bacterium]
MGATHINAGTYTVNWSFAGNSNYQKASGTATVTIGKANASIDVSGGTFTYDGNPHGATGTATGVKEEALSGLNLGASFTNVPGGTANWTFTDATGNYNNATGSAQIVITKANATIQVDGKTVTYDGQAHGATGTAKGAGGENLNSLLSLGDSFTNVPGGTATWSFKGDANHNEANGTAKIVINKAPSSVSIDNLPSSGTVGGSFTPTFAVVGDGTTSVTSQTASICSVTGGVVSYVADGTCTLQAAVTAGTNYEAATGEPQSFTIVQKVSSCVVTASFQAPIQNNVRNLAKLGNVVPVKVSLTDCNGQAVTNQSLFITVVAGTNNVSLDANVAVTESVSSADSGQQLRLVDSKHMYNLSTKGLTAGTDYTIRIHTGSTSGTVIANAVLQPRK